MRVTRLLLAGLTAGVGCAELGYSDRVLWRLPSPDGKLVAVCQEIPEFDGPSYSVRLERPDGTLVTPLYRNGDGDPCSEMAWSPDGRLVAVLSGHVARLHFIDVAWALEQKGDWRSWRWPQLEIGTPQQRNGGGLRFTGAREIELQVCAAAPYTPGDAGRRTCGTSGQIRRVAVPFQARHP
jgi:hypothetical protein